MFSHVDDFSVARGEDFMKKIVELISERLTVSKVNYDKFRLRCRDLRRKYKFLSQFGLLQL